MKKIKIQIKTFVGNLLFEYKKEDNTIKKTIQEAVKRGVDLRGADLIGAYLRGADLRGADLIGAYLRGADLIGADLIGADLRGADLRGAYLRGADLRGADLIGADLIGADLIGADLIGADLIGADLGGADLRGADLNKIKHLYQIIPETGSFAAWKKGSNNCLIKLEIPKEAKRHNCLGGRKCRAEFVKVLDIRNSKGHKIKECNSGTHYLKVLYQIGEIIKPDSYDSDPLKECSNGIHFFVTKQEAKNW